MKVFGQEIGDRRAVYQDKVLGIAFVERPQDPPDGYDIIVNGFGHFVLPSRVLPDLTKPEYSTADVMRSLTTVNEIIPHILESSRISPEQLHIALLKVKQGRLEDEIENMCLTCPREVGD